MRDYFQKETKLQIDWFKDFSIFISTHEGNIGIADHLCVSFSRSNYQLIHTRMGQANFVAQVFDGNTKNSTWKSQNNVTMWEKIDT